MVSSEPSLTPIPLCSCLFGGIPSLSHGFFWLIIAFDVPRAPPRVCVDIRFGHRSRVTAPSCVSVPPFPFQCLLDVAIQALLLVPAPSGIVALPVAWLPLMMRDVAGYPHFPQCLYPPALHSKLVLLDVRSQRWNLHVYSVSLMLEAMLNYAECECWKVLWNCEEMTG